ncbi:hypothetical protein [Microbacterium oleivorans]|uniref:Uncharacterized protein n=1 Tax=Microbacterium oleivorans TaxID=273677 RepID=A0A7D5EVM9_9MICO|nr:hypothetical protein [Microbacterium oleivorans]QLD10866.1 hypothetical protein HW566_03160 [Microbacterium oleivorans]
MGWWQRQIVGMWSGTARWLPISQIVLCVAMGALKLSEIVAGHGDGADVAFAIGWGIFAAWWLATLAAFLVVKRRIVNTPPAPEGQR